MLAAHDRRQDRFLRNRRAADHFDDDVDLRIGHDGAHVVDDRDGIADDGPRARDVARGDHRDLDPPSRAPRDLFAIALEHAKRSAADGTDAEEADLHGFHSKSLSGAMVPPSMRNVRSMNAGRSAA